MLNNVFKSILKNSITPLILILVWVWDVRPFYSFTLYINQYLVTPLVSEEKLTSTGFVAIDIALITFMINSAVSIIFSIFTKPILININIEDSANGKNYTSIDGSHIGESLPTLLKITMSAEIKSYIYPLFVFLKGINLFIRWDSAWLSITPQFNDPQHKIKVTRKPGKISFNIMDVLTKDDLSTKVDGKLSVMLNNGMKKEGNVSTRIESGINNIIMNKIISLGILTFLVNIKTKKCEIVVSERG